MMKPFATLWKGVSKKFWPGSNFSERRPANYLHTGAGNRDEKVNVRIKLHLRLSSMNHRRDTLKHGF